MNGFDDGADFAIKVSSRLLTIPEYAEHVDRIMSFLASSRRLRNSPMELFELQVDMAGTLLGLEESQRRIESEIQEGKHRDNPEARTSVDVCKRLHLIVKEIADGIAWRSLNYDRLLLRLLALKPQTGYLDESSTRGEVAAAGKYVEETGELVILNDLTNYLRHADFTSIAEGSIALNEVKGGRASAQNRRATRQRKNAESLIDFWRTGERSSERGPEKLAVFETKLHSHCAELQQLIVEARNKGYANGRVSSSLAISVLDVAVLQPEVKRSNPHHLIRDPFEQSKFAIRQHSLHNFARFLPNIAPYSIFPLQDQDCMDILTGRLWIITHFNLRNLVRCLMRRNVSVELPKGEPDNLLPGQIVAHELDHPILVERGIFRSQVSTASLARMTFELLDEEAFADFVVEGLDRAIEDVGAVTFPLFADEPSLWN